VDVNPVLLNSFGLGMQDVSSMLSRQNANSPKGQMVNATTSADIVTNDQLLKAADYIPLIVGYHDGAAVKLSDVAKVQDATENIRAAGMASPRSLSLFTASLAQISLTPLTASATPFLPSRPPFPQPLISMSS
jgi:Cu/Ag efflux pump CusA